MPEEIPETPGKLKYSSDLARWDCFNKQELTEYIISIEQPERNEAESYRESKRVYQIQDRFMSTVLFSDDNKRWPQINQRLDDLFKVKWNRYLICLQIVFSQDNTIFFCYWFQ